MKLSAQAKAFIAQMTEGVDERLAPKFQAQADSIAALETRLRAVEDPRRSHNLPGVEEEKFRGNTYSIGRAIGSYALGGMDCMRQYAPLEYAAHLEIQENTIEAKMAAASNYALGSIPDSGGGVLIPNEIHRELLVEKLEAATTALQLGVTQLDFTSTPVQIPVETQNPEAYPVAENAQNQETTAEWDEMELSPKMASSFIKGSRRFFQMAQGSEKLLTDKLTGAMGRLHDQWIYSGTGLAGQPRGIKNSAGLSSVDFTGTIAAGSKVGPAFYRKLLEMEDNTFEANATELGSLGWAMNPRVFRAMRLIGSENEIPAAGESNLEMSRRLFSAGAERRVLDYPFVRSNHLSKLADNGDLLYGPWASVIFANWGNLTIESSREADGAFRRHQIVLGIWSEVDVAVQHPEAFSIATGMPIQHIGT